LTNPIGSPIAVVNGTADSTPGQTFPAGSNTVTAVYSGGTGFAGSTGTDTFQVWAGPPPIITSVVINQDISALYNAAGQPTPGVQRSMVEDIVYTFSEPVNFTSDPNVFSIAVASGWTGTVPTTLEWAAVAGSGNTQWEVDFGPGLPSIANGAYAITLNDPASITAQSDGQALSLAPNGISGATQSFYRLFGDINGDEFVNGGDSNKFKQALTTYNPAFDVNQDGSVNAGDANKFKADLTVSFSGFTPTI
jgi:Dockerin type I domain